MSIHHLRRLICVAVIASGVLLAGCDTTTAPPATPPAGATAAPGGGPAGPTSTPGGAGQGQPSAYPLPQAYPEPSNSARPTP
jgi:hypothetical protein